MAIFESFPVHHGRPVFLEAHLQRLKAASLRCGFHVDLGALDQIEEILNQIRFDAFARVYVTGGDGSPTSAATECRIFVMAEPREKLQEAQVQSGYRLSIHPAPYLPIFGGIKTANYWANIHARQLAIERQNHESLLFGGNGELISACMANVFVASKGVLRTPPLNSGARDGVMRKWVLERCQVLECALSLEDVRTADELFLTSSGIGIMPVTAVEGRLLPSRRFSAPLRNEYLAFLASLSKA